LLQTVELDFWEERVRKSPAVDESNTQWKSYGEEHAPFRFPQKVLISRVEDVVLLSARGISGGGSCATCSLVCLKQ